MIRLRPIVREPDQRYWRRRANRRVRKARATRTAVRTSGALFLHALVAAALLLVGARVARALAGSSEFALERIDLEGTRRSSPQAIRGRLAAFYGKNLLELDLAAVQAALLEDRWVRSASLKRVLPGRLRIRVIERSPAALALLRGTAYVIDDRGAPIGPSGPDLADDLPVLTGLERRSAGEQRAALVAGVSALQRIGALAPQLLDELSAVDLSQPDRLVLSTVRPGPRILLDAALVERNLERYLALRSEIDRRLETVAYVDLRWRGRVTVLPALRREERRPPANPDFRRR
ncbi:MAG TPA: FtsQ-type POTRA domain-containing protein [Candidatus Polarisedimenticolaceae bacterium]|nr:FtsQ-type POTRA domain-containing protein [Candidatus Polarisedimenticolaceae bacterium]